MARRPLVIVQPAARVEVQPVVHVADMAASVAFYQRLGGEIVHGRPDDDWVLMQLGTIQMSLIAGAPAGGAAAVELHLASEASVERLAADLPGARMSADPCFGPQLLVRSPDGLLIRISRREPDPA
jgi:catechol 2,3-dioxygenase-like lactoylglutathione lyase family enzyme